MLRIEKLPSISGVVAGETATLGCPVSFAYHDIRLSYAGVTLAQMKNIEVEVAGKTIQRYKDGQELDDINVHHGRPAAAGILVIPFERTEMANIVDRRKFILGTLDVSSLQVKFDIDAGAAAPVVSATGLVSKNQPLGLITKVKAINLDFSGSGAQEIDNLPLGSAALCAIHLGKSDISQVEVLADSVRVVSASKTMLEQLASCYGKAPVSARFTVVDFCIDGDPRNSLESAAVHDLRIQPTLDTSGAVRCVLELFDQWQGV
jgi:hypothetical protein